MPPMPGMDPGSAPGGLPPPGGSPALPKSLAGAPPTGPGASPALSPGDGAGRKAAAISGIKAVLEHLLKMSTAFDPGSKEQQALIRAVSSLNPIFGRAEAVNMVPAALQSMMSGAAKPQTAPPPPAGMPPGGKPPMPSMGPTGLGAEGGEL